MNRSKLEKRTRTFAVAIIGFVDKVPKNEAAGLMVSQLLRSALSIGANYREATRAESRRDFVHKIAIVEKEAAESLYWLGLFAEAMIVSQDDIKPLAHECNQLVAIFTRIGKTAKQTASPKSDNRNPTSEIPS